MLRRILYAGAALFITNVILSILPSCERKDRCLPVKCLYTDSAWVRMINGVDGSEVSMSGDSILATHLRINVFVTGTITVCSKPKKRSSDLSLFPKAYAWSVKPCDLHLKGDSVISYEVCSNVDYDTTHPAGSNLMDIITTNSIPMNAALEGVDNFSFHFSVKSMPADTGRHIFTIKLTQMNGDVITVNTPEIKLLK